MNSETSGNAVGWYLGAFMLGAAAGVTIGLLTAPRAGRETRERLRTAAMDLGSRMEHIPGTIQKTLAKAVKAGQSTLEQARSDVS